MTVQSEVRAVRVAPGRILLERGPYRRVVVGPVAGVTEWLAAELGRGAAPDAVLAALPPTLREPAAALLAELDVPARAGPGASASPVRHGPVRLAGRGTVVDVAADRLAALGVRLAAGDDPPTVVAAVDERGLTDELFALAAAAQEAGVGYVPAWFAGIKGHVGPLTTPGNACLRCYALRRASNDARPEVSEALRRHAASAGAGRSRLPFAVLAVVGETLASVVHAHLFGRVETVPTNRVVELDVVTFCVRTRPVRRVPGCPACSSTDAS